ncbi:hypothetical protein ENSA5_49550 [Enhygromyxa salina]|uniref:Cytochrome c domain-containing protein n=1 Tax=Enhygromyxa salina TaxID=215803 RepID=A0A2S9XHP3_9BACT|nr:hypothetical protein [Enhygromyxa salina]PRP92385.1 hypothetical protein ENSA5_49550 [Enhygromyxa salina]
MIGERMRSCWWALLVVLCTVTTSCGEADDGTEGGMQKSPWPLPRACVPPSGMGSPATIEEVVALINALPKPTSLACVLESLDRPLAMYASTSIASAQPAAGPHSPRVFVFRDDLTMSVVLEGNSRDTLELSYAIGDRLSIKAELVFPVEEVLEPSAPYDQVAVGGGTTCGVCHGSEVTVPSLDFAEAWASDVFQDDPDEALSRSFLRQLALDCDHETEPERCELLDAIFGHGELEPGDLPRDSLVCRPP